MDTLSRMKQVSAAPRTTLKRRLHTHTHTHSFTHPLTHTHTPSPTHSLLHPPTHSLLHSLTHSFTHSLTHSFTRSQTNRKLCSPGVMCKLVCLCSGSESPFHVVAMAQRRDAMVGRVCCGAQPVVATAAALWRNRGVKRCHVAVSMPLSIPMLATTKVANTNVNANSTRRASGCDRACLQPGMLPVFCAFASCVCLCLFVFVWFVAILGKCSSSSVITKRSSLSLSSHFGK